MGYELRTGALYYLDATGRMCGEYKEWHKNGAIYIHAFKLDGHYYGEYRRWSVCGDLQYWSLDDSDGSELIVHNGETVLTEEQVTLLARSRGLPLLADIPTTEEGLLMWTLKYPDLPLHPMGILDNIIKG